MKKRMQSSMSALLLVALLLSLCACRSSDDCSSVPSGSSEPDGHETPALCYDGTPVTIAFAHTFGSRYWTLLDTYITQFQQLYPSITVTHAQVGTAADICDMVQMLKDSGNYPNVVVCQAEQVESYREWDVIVSLDDMIASTAQQGETSFGLTDQQKKDFIDTFYADGRHPGDSKMYSLPLQRYANILYYNQDFFTEHGLVAPETLEEMEDVCRKICQLDPDCVPLVVENADEWYIDLCIQNGQSIYSREGLFAGDVPASIVKQLSDWQQKGYLELDVQDRSVNAGSRFAGEGDIPRCYMVISRSVAPGYFYSDFEVGISAPPQKYTGQKQLLCGGSNLCILKSDDAQEDLASWLLIEYLSTNPGFQAELAMLGGYLPVVESAQEDPAYQDHLAAADGRDNLPGRMAQFCLGDHIYNGLSPLAQTISAHGGIEDMLNMAIYEGNGSDSAIKNALQQMQDQKE